MSVAIGNTRVNSIFNAPDTAHVQWFSTSWRYAPTRNEAILLSFPLQCGGIQSLTTFRNVFWLAGMYFRITGQSFVLNIDSSLGKTTYQKIYVYEFQICVYNCIRGTRQNETTRSEKVVEFTAKYVMVFR